MRLPFVTRAHFEEVKAQRDSLVRELAEVKLEFKKYTNQIVFRATGMALDPELLPKPYQPAPRKSEPENPLMDPKPEQRGPQSIRATLRQVEEARERQYQEEIEKSSNVADISKGA